MRKIQFIIILLSIAMAGLSQSKNFIDQPYLETSAKVDTMVSPDRIFLSILITEKDTKGKISVEELENKMAESLKSIGIDLKKQLVLIDLSSNFKKYFLKQQDVLKSKAYSLITYDGMTAGKVIVELEKIGISNIDLEKTEYSGMEDLKIHLKTQAVLKAKNQGEAMTVALNQTLGKAIMITDTPNNTISSLEGRASGIRMEYIQISKQTFEPINIEFEKIKVESEVNVTFIIN